jgi:hypothetical protein
MTEGNFGNSLPSLTTGLGAQALGNWVSSWRAQLLHF